MKELYERFAGWLWIGPRHYWLPIVWSLLSFVSSCRPSFAQGPEIIVGPGLEELKRLAGRNDQTALVYMVFLMMAVGFVAAFFLIRYVLNHAREIHSESNKTLLDISGKHENRCDKLTTTFSTECAQLRQVILRIMSDARDMVHATRDIAQTAVNGKDFVDLYHKREAELKATRDREMQP